MTFRIKDIPNSLTVVRIVLAVFIFLLLSLGRHWSDKIAGFLFILGAVTDFLDGLIARRFSVASDFGKIVDPIADKVFMFSVLLPFVVRGIIPGYVLYVIFFRDMIVMALRNMMVLKGQVSASDILGKMKTLVLFVSSILCMFGYLKYGALGLYIGAFISLASGVNYCFKYFKRVG
ncbi:MAG: CDP-diacylglycerol--glycerol-3-phosphate 3-phosphatidyltransferase [candidate division WOR-3 bacterium]